MGFPIGTATTITATKDRETIRIEIQVDTDALGQNPKYTLRGHGQVVQRDAGGNEIMRNPTIHTVTVLDAQLPPGLKTTFSNIIAKLDTLPSDDGQA